MNSKSKEYIKTVAMLGILSALAAVCAGVFPMGLTLRIGEYIKLSPVFLIVALAGNLYGVFGAALVAFVGDLLQSLLAGLGFSPLILVVNVLCGMCFGWLLRNSNSIFKIVASVLLTQVIGSLVLITLALKIQYGMPIFPTIYWRMVQTAILIALETVVLWFCLRVLKLPEKIKSVK